MNLAPPTAIFMFAYHDIPNLYAHLVKSLSLIRIFRIEKIFRNLRRSLTKFKMGERKITFIFTVLWWVVLMHWSACLQVLPGLLYSGFDRDADIDAWYTNFNFTSASFVRKYYYCFYKSMKAVSGSGFVVNMDARSYYDKIYTAVLVIAGRIATCVIFALLFSFYQGYGSSSLQYHQIITQLENYASQNRIPKSTKSKLKSNYNYLFQKKFFYEKQILQTVPATLKQQILIHKTHSLVKNSPFFQNLPGTLIIKIVSALTLELFLENDVIYSVGNAGTSIYFIISGSVAFYSPSGREVCHFKEDDYFGEICLMTNNEYRHSNVIALEITECYK